MEKTDLKFQGEGGEWGWGLGGVGAVGKFLRNSGKFPENHCVVR